MMGSSTMRDQLEEGHGGSWIASCRVGGFVALDGGCESARTGMEV